VSPISINDRTGNLLEKMDSVFGTDQFNYDPIGRITGQTDPERKYKSYLYDPAGDLLKTRIQSENEDWSRAGEHEGISYRFDQVGNLVERTEKQDKTEFVLDTGGRLVESVSGGKKTVYQYDPLGRRISKETDGVKACFYWDGDALLGDVTGDDTREWVYYPVNFEPLAMVRNEEFYLYHNDPNGCPSYLLDESGKVVWAARYDAWGKVKRLLVDEVDQPLRLQGQYFDRETGLHYNRFRYYEPQVGSFISQDPLGLLAGENFYKFAPNIYAWADPLGLICEAGRTGGRSENYAKKYLKSKGYTDIQSFQNSSGHGVDVVARNPVTGQYDFFEVKGTRGSRTPSLSSAQKNPKTFVDSRLLKISDQRGTHGVSKSLGKEADVIFDRLKYQNNTQYQKIDVFLNDDLKLIDIKVGNWP
jgi:RHS repeat-associated protein